MFSWITVLITYHFLKYLFPLSIILVLFFASGIMLSHILIFALPLCWLKPSPTQLIVFPFFFCVNMIWLFPVRVQRTIFGVWNTSQLPKIRGVKWWKWTSFSRAMYQQESKQTSRPSPLNVAIGRSADSAFRCLTYTRCQSMSRSRSTQCRIESW